jgi:hypothetical protein
MEGAHEISLAGSPQGAAGGTFKTFGATSLSARSTWLAFGIGLLAHGVESDGFLCDPVVLDTVGNHAHSESFTALPRHDIL